MRALAFTVTWDPTIRGYLVVAVAVAILMGTVYLLLATNTGTRLGFLIAVGGFFGWMSIMGMAWWVYGIGLKGEAAVWRAEEVVVSDSPDDLTLAELEAAHDLSGWAELPEGDTKRGDAEAAASEALTGEDSRLQSFESTSDFVIIDAFDKGGKDPDSFWSNFPGPHPPHYAIVQVQPVLEQSVELGETPPPAEADPDANVYSVVMVRDLGNLRLPPALITIASLLVFAVVCDVLHRRDKLAARNREPAEV